MHEVLCHGDLGRCNCHSAAMSQPARCQQLAMSSSDAATNMQTPILSFRLCEHLAPPAEVFVAPLVDVGSSRAAALLLGRLRALQRRADYRSRHKTNGASRGAWGRCAEEACGAVAEPASWGMGARLVPSTRRCQGMLRATAVEEACAKRQEMMFGCRCECERRLAKKGCSLCLAVKGFVAVQDRW